MSEKIDIRNQEDYKEAKYDSEKHAIATLSSFIKGVRRVIRRFNGKNIYSITDVEVEILIGYIKAGASVKVVKAYLKKVLKPEVTVGEFLRAGEQLKGFLPAFNRNIDKSEENEQSLEDVEQDLRDMGIKI